MAALFAAGLSAFDALALAKGTRVVLVTNATAALPAPVPVPALVGDAACGCAACGCRYDGAAVWRPDDVDKDVDEDANEDEDEDREEEAAAAAVVLGGGGRGIEPAAVTALSVVGCAVCGADAGGALRLVLGAFARIGAGWNESDGGGGGEGEGGRGGGVEGGAEAAWRVGAGQTARGHTELLAEPPPSALAMALTGMGFASGARIGVSE